MNRSLSDLPGGAFGISDTEDADFSEQPPAQTPEPREPEGEMTDKEAELQAIRDMDEGEIEKAHENKVARLKEGELHKKELRPYTDGLPFDLARIELAISEHTKVLREHSVKVGCYLIWVREELPHGDFLRFIEERLPFGESSVYQLMAIADREVHLREKLPRARNIFALLSAGSKKKAELFVGITDEEWQEIEKSGTIFGRAIDDVAKMGYRQVQEELRKARAENKRIWEKRKALEVDLAEAKEKLKPKPGVLQTMHDLKTGDPEFGRVMEAVGSYWKWADRTFDAIETDKEQRNRREMWLRGLKSKVEEVAAAMCPWLVFGLSPLEQEVGDIIESEKASEGGEKTGEDGT